MFCRIPTESQLLPVTSPIEKIGLSALRSNAARYEAFVAQALSSHPHRNPDTTLWLCRLSAHFASAHHSGHFADSRLEETCLDLGRRLERLITWRRVRPASQWKGDLRSRGRRRVLHVATQAPPIGGHTRTILNWVENDPASCHSLLLIDQSQTGVPEWLKHSIWQSGGNLFSLATHTSPISKAWWTRRAAQRFADVVICHHHPFDVIPTVAFATEAGPPVAVVNHADHCFWMGSSIADIVINQRPISSRIAADRRGVRAQALLPIPLREIHSRLDKSEARRQLQIDKDQIVLLSVGRGEKYFPIGRHNFLEVGKSILERNPCAHLYVVGLSREQSRNFGDFRTHERLHFVGGVCNPSVYYAAADLYLEGFPFGSQTALLEAGMAQLVPVRAFEPISELLVTDDLALEGLIPRPNSDKAYIEQVEGLLASYQHRVTLGKQLRQRIVDAHTGDIWRRSLNEIYEVAASASHRPHALMLSKEWAADDIALAAWDSARCAHGGEPKAQSEAVRSALECAYAVRQWGDYGTAWQFLRTALSYGKPTARLCKSATSLMAHQLLSLPKPKVGALRRTVGGCVWNIHDNEKRTFCNPHTRSPSVAPSEELVSIVIPCFRGERFLGGAIESCLSQTYRNIEVIIVDDASPDNCGRIAQQYSTKDNRVRLIRRVQNGGVARAFNDGFHAARGRYFSRLAQDDLFRPTAVEVMLRHLQVHPDAGLVYCDMDRIDEAGRVIGRFATEPPESALRDGDRVGLCVMWPRAVWLRVGEFDPAYDAAEDFEYWLRLSGQFKISRCVGPAPFCFRIHAEMGSRQFSGKQDLLMKQLLALQSSSVLTASRLLSEGYSEAAYAYRERGQFCSAFRHGIHAILCRPVGYQKYGALAKTMVRAVFEN